MSFLSDGIYLIAVSCYRTLSLAIICFFWRSQHHTPLLFRHQAHKDKQRLPALPFQPGMEEIKLCNYVL
jgi:hypothetical protein